jgi:hypothetical protein
VPTLKIGTVFATDEPTDAIRRIMTFLESAPADEFYTTQQIATIGGIAYATFRCQSAARLSFIIGNSEIVGCRRIWGSAAAIADLRRRLAEERAKAVNC